MVVDDHSSFVASTQSGQMAPDAKHNVTRVLLQWRAGPTSSKYKQIDETNSTTAARSSSTVLLLLSVFFLLLTRSLTQVAVSSSGAGGLFVDKQSIFPVLVQAHSIACQKLHSLLDVLPRSLLIRSSCIVHIQSNHSYRTPNESL